jgi:hypothetical protein
MIEWSKDNTKTFHITITIPITTIIINTVIPITNSKLTTQLYDKRDDFNFSIVNFLYLYSNILALPAYGVYISQLIRYARACSAYDQCLVRGSLLTNNN